MNQESRAEKNVFGFDSEYLRAFFRATGTGPREALRALRVGGPFDDSKFLTHCRGCGVEKAEPIRWYWDRDFKCKCGGEFDAEPLFVLNRHGAVVLRPAQSGAPAWQVAAAKESVDLLLRTFFQPIQDVEH
jgi:hypothetical protein